MIEPGRPPSIMVRATARVMRNAPPTMMSTWRRNWSTGMSSSPLVLNWTALFNNTSMRPHRSITSATTLSTAASSVTSAQIAIASPPAALISATTASAGLRLDEDSPGSRDNARFLCEASALAYLPAEAGEARFKELLGLNARLFSAGNAQAWLATDDTNIVVAFRGTESPMSIDGLKDVLLTDAMNLLVVPEGRLGHDLAAAGVGARFHKGFADAIATIWDPLAAAIDAEVKKRDRPVWITGHSLGGALALYAAWLLKRRFIPVHEVCTFGGPMIGNRVASEAFNREFSGRIFRYVNGRDPVPKLPTLSLVANEFLHVDAERLVGKDPVTRIVDLVGTAQTGDPGGGQDHGVVVACALSSDRGVDVAPDASDVQIGPQRCQLHAPTGRSGAHDRAPRQLGELGAHVAEDREPPVP